MADLNFKQAIRIEALKVSTDLVAAGMTALSDPHEIDFSRIRESVIHMAEHFSGWIAFGNSEERLVTPEAEEGGEF